MTEASDHTAPRRTFYQLLGNTIVANVTNMTVWFAVIFFVYLETRSVIATSITSGLYFVAVSLSGIWFGSLVDRHPKKRMMLLSGVASLAIYAVALGIYLLAPAEAFRSLASPILWAFVSLLIAGVLAGNIRGIALLTVVTLLFDAEERDRANGLAGTASGVAMLIVSAISGFLVGTAGMLWVFIVGIALTVATLAHLLTLHVPEGAAPAAGADPPRVDLRGTFLVVTAVPGLLALILFTTINNLLGGVFAGLLDAYGLSLVAVEVWGVLFAVVSTGFILGGLAVARWGLGANPVRTLFLGNVALWVIAAVFTVQPSIVLLTGGMLAYMGVVPLIEASEQTIVQKVVPFERQGRVFGFAQSVELAATPVATFLIGPIAEIVFIPWMTGGRGADLIGGWFGTGPNRGIALVFTVTGVIGLLLTLAAMRTRYYRLLSERYAAAEGE